MTCGTCYGAYKDVGRMSTLGQAMIL
ncbi:hypothetical protein CCACVL1_12250 [Corchorus capsularis]|uniref:Uncharacterized protein n=1 Tax=Corchorus capsularis TaxID=210143 RepID=A0A1R3IGP5_COCAP|nr:hypothetical protein CCACVL1_12250 [Corchorus capsularis]